MRSARLTLLLLIGATSQPICADNYYRWVDENGTLHLSDTKPALSLEMGIDISPLPLPDHQSNALTPPTPDTPDAPDSPATPAAAPNATAVTLRYPPDNATIRNNSGTIALDIATNVPLGNGQSLKVYLDGDAQPLGAELTLNNVDRGSHTIKVQLLQNGKVIASTDPITVFLHRAIQAKPSPTGTPTPH